MQHMEEKMSLKWCCLLQGVVIAGMVLLSTPFPIEKADAVSTAKPILGDAASQSENNNVGFAFDGESENPNLTFHQTIPSGKARKNNAVPFPNHHNDHHPQSADITSHPTQPVIGMESVERAESAGNRPGLEATTMVSPPMLDRGLRRSQQHMGGEATGRDGPPGTPDPAVALVQDMPQVAPLSTPGQKGVGRKDGAQSAEYREGEVQKVKDGEDREQDVLEEERGEGGERLSSGENGEEGQASGSTTEQREHVAISDSAAEQGGNGSSEKEEVAKRRSKDDGNDEGKKKGEGGERRKTDAKNVEQKTKDGRQEKGGQVEVFNENSDLDDIRQEDGNRKEERKGLVNRDNKGRQRDRQGEETEAHRKDLDRRDRKMEYTQGEGHHAQHKQVEANSEGNKQEEDELMDVEQMMVREGEDRVGDDQRGEERQHQDKEEDIGEEKEEEAEKEETTGDGPPEDMRDAPSSQIARARTGPVTTRRRQSTHTGVDDVFRCPDNRLLLSVHGDPAHCGRFYLCVRYFVQHLPVTIRLHYQCPNAARYDAANQKCTRETDCTRNLP